MILITTLIIAVSISMDAFSLSLVYGTLNLKPRKIKQLSIMVGIFHFIMPLLGFLAGEFIIDGLHMPSHIVLAVIFGFIGLEMIISSFKKKEELLLLDLKGLILFAFTVSIDSFSVGAGFNAISSNYLISASIFFITSFLFTYMGLNIGKKINEKIGFLSTVIGGGILIVIGILYITIV
jgi:putative Mn2+ efflux pump MntP